MSRSKPRRFTKVLLILAIVCLWLVPTGDLLARQSAAKPAASTGKKQAEKKESTDKDDTPRPLEPWEKFVPDLANMDLSGSEDRAWEYRPYKVACWFCLDGSPRVNAIYPQAAQEIANRSELLDASGWTLSIGRAPARYRSLFLKYIDSPERCVGFTEQEVLNEYDKLMIVCLSDQASQIKAIVREFDVQTQQWGPINRQSIPFGRSAGQQLMNAIARSFMPLAQIERVTEIEYEVEVEVEVEVEIEVEVDGKKEKQIKKEKQKKKETKKRDQVLMLLRAVRSCYTTELVEVTAQTESEDGLNAQPESVATDSGTENQPQAEASAEQSTGDEVPAPQYKQFELRVVPESNSPAFITRADLFLPVIRRTDRAGNLKGLEPLEFTFLTVDEQQDAEVRASIQSTGRNPLGQRKSKKAKKLALVIRPPKNSTTLKLLSREKEPIPMEGFTIKEVPVGAPRTVTGVPIGRSDYRGEFEVTPSDTGMRVLVISRGGRNLAKLPIVPGLYKSVETSLPNDEVRLYSEGVFKAFQTELLGLIIQRQYVQGNLDGALKKKIVKEATKFYDELRELETLQQFSQRLINAVDELKSKTNDKREKKYIDDRLKSLQKIIKKEVDKELKIHYNKETKKYGKDYQEQILDLKAEANKNG